MEAGGDHAEEFGKYHFGSAHEHVKGVLGKHGIDVGGGGAKPADPYGHPTVVGKAEKLQGGDASKAHGMHFAGKQFSASGKEGKSSHDGTPVRHFREVTSSGADDGQHVWMDGHGRVHADSSSEVKSLRAAHEAHQKKAAAKPATPEVKSNNTDWGFHGEAHKAHLSAKLGPDSYYNNAKESDLSEAHEVAAKKFSATANHLVQAGHFDNHDQARDYLDSTHGRHLHDAMGHFGDASKVPWLGKDVQHYKAKVGGMRKSMLIIRHDLLK
jgi:hypothetical protein